MVKRHKRSLTLAALVLLLAQVFLMTFCNITAIAVTKEESSGSLFDNEFGNASVSYEETSTERLKWTVHLTKATQETATRFMVEVTGDGQAVTPENVQTLSKSNQEMNFASGNGDGQITAGMYEKTATTNGSAKISFETGRSYTTMTVKPKLITNADPATDLLAGNTGVSFTLPVAVTPESESAEGEVATSEVSTSETATSESSATEATSSTEAAATEETTATSEVTESTSTEQSATTDSTTASTEATEESDVVDEATEESNDSTVAFQNLVEYEANITSLRFEKEWIMPEGMDPHDLPPIKIQIMQGDKPYKDPIEVSWSELDELNENGNYVSIREWKNLPIVRDEQGNILEYTIQELPNEYYEEGEPNVTASTIDSIEYVKNNSGNDWDIEPTFVIARLTEGGNFAIWTLNHIETDQEKLAFLQNVLAAAGTKLDSPLDKLDLSNINNFVWFEGPNVKADVGTGQVEINITFNPDGSIDNSKMIFSGKSTWTHFATGGYSTRQVDIANTYIPQNKISIAKKWDDNSNAYSTRENIQVVLQQSLDGGNTWTDYTKTNDDGTIEGILEITTKMTGNNFSQEDIDVPSRVGGKAATYRIIERVWNGSEYVDEVDGIKNRIEGYKNPVYSPESTASSDTLTVTNTLLTRDFNFTKVGNDGETSLTGVSFKLTGDNGYTSGDEVVKSDEDGNVNFSDLPIGHYTLTETDTVAGYQAGGPWTFDVKDVNGELVIVWQDGTKPSDIKIINTLKPFDLTVNKTDDQGKALEGAEFTLVDANGKEFDVTVNGASFTFTGLTAPGTYILTETKAPDGYRGLTEPITIEIDALGQVKVDGVVQEDVLAENGNNKITLSVANDPKAPLPSTGGPGTLLFSLIGMLALGATGLYFYFRKDQEVA
ncbi:LPXTG cell wall anchor domain-containing protein [Enterococcus asini]|uniref:LPXTG cell wall anchor domain-containing protein n=1 Tax=Enterococcus asini TaxID=57732 RepID=UPI00266B63CB|nr:LPXTG cell wall anchor domain-containing protein [Enterococcus asini]